MLVSANYKLSFDALRRELGGIDAWLPVVDTDGINVCCYAGEGIFTAETASVTRCGSGPAWAARSR